MNPNELSSAELLEEAARIRAEADRDGRAMFDAHEGEILRLAAAVEESRRRTGIGKVVDDFLGGIIGEKRLAEKRLGELREREARIEQLLRDREGTKGALEKAEANLERVQALGDQFRKAASPAGIRAIFQKKAWAISEVNFAAHAIEASKEAAAAKILGENFAVFVDAATGQAANLRQQLAGIETELRKHKA
jgi:hypothetical protein